VLSYVVIAVKILSFEDKTTMCGKAQPDGHPAVELIETPVLLFVSGRKYTCNATFQLTTSCCNTEDICYKVA